MTPLKINLVLIAIALLFNEYFIYYLQRLRWDSLACETSECERVLLIADPQILGDKNEFMISRWDNDRHLRQSFQQAFRHAKPNAVLFLGDLMDEGSIADDAKFIKYFKRFKKIFDISRDIQCIYAPGDNDIGGEWPEPVDDLKVKRFEKFFGNNHSMKLGKNIRIFNINLITSEIPVLTVDNVTTTQVFMSHYPLIHRPNSASYAMTRSFAVKPVVFSAHDHESALVIADISTLSSRSFPLDRVKTFDLEVLKKRNKILEIKVPSCSYRMGTLTIGFGQAVFDNGELKYSPLFVISRFYQHAYYIISLLLFILLNIYLRNKRSRVS